MLLSLTVSSGCALSLTPNNDANALDPTPQVQVITSIGDFVIELDREAAPTTVASFLQYVQEDFFDGTIVQSSLPGESIAAGGFLPGMIRKAATRAPIPNEADNGLSNVRGTVAMLWDDSDDPDSATTQFFINLGDNTQFDPSADFAGFAVFGTVVDGMGIVDAISSLPTSEVNGFANVPVSAVILDIVELGPDDPIASLIDWISTNATQAGYDTLRYLMPTLLGYAFQQLY
jgi:peptidyl-prolyl cis-trans isomerase A (cyclophilin A)